ncbi:MAG: YjbQ family protein [Ignisphaera sp.]
MDLKVYRLTFESKGYEAQDITAHIANVIRESGLVNGIAVLYTNERGCSVTEIEYEPELLADLEELLHKVGCVDKLLCNVIIGKNVFVPVVKGSMFLGQFKRIVFVDISRIEGSKSVVLVLEGVFKSS